MSHKNAGCIFSKADGFSCSLDVLYGCLGINKFKVLILTVFRIRIHRIHMFLGLPDPDPLVRGMDPATDPDHHAKIVRKTLIPPIL